MPISPQDWEAIYQAINAMQRPSEVIQGKVTKRDTENMLVWINEVGDQPIPIYSFDYQIKYYDVDQRGVSTIKRTDITKKDVSTLCPDIGDTILVLKQFGTNRLPKCIGVLRSANFTTSED